MRPAGRWILAMAAGLAAGPAGCGGDPPPTPPANARQTHDGRLVAANRQLERQVRDLRGEIGRLEQAATARAAELKIARARLADREAELEALRRAGPDAPAAVRARTSPTDGAAETAPAYVQRLFEALAADPDKGLEDEVDWPRFAANMLAGETGPGGAPMDLDEAAATLAAMSEQDRNDYLAGSRAMLDGLLGGERGLAALRPRVGQHYRLGEVVRVELLAGPAGGAEQRFIVTVAKPEDRWRIVGISRD